MRLRYLHISDLHLIGQRKDKEGWAVEQFNQDMVTHSMTKTIERAVHQEGKTLDLIFITGDLAKSGKPDDYEVVEVFCERLLEATGVPRQRLFLVPGNHDVDRDKIDKTHLKWWYSFGTVDEVTGILGSPEAFPVLMRKFDAFNAFSERALGRSVYSKTNYSFFEAVSIPKDGAVVLVNVVGLNSALFAGYDGDDKQNLAFGLPQVNGALSKLDKQHAHLTIVLFHHPFDCSHPDDKKACSKRLMKIADLILTGHLHEPENMWIRSGEGEAVFISAGASFEKRNSEENSFNVGEIDLRTGAGKVQFYKYMPNDNCWIEKTYVDRNGGEQRIFSFEIERIKPKEAVDNLLPKIQPGTPLADLIVAVTPDIRDCIRRVELIANCKQIHDCLHEVLQNVIRPLREEVLSVWEQEETLSKSRVKVIIGCVNKAAEQRGTIKGVRKSIGPEHWALRDGVDKVLSEVQHWMDWAKDLDWTEDLLSARSWPSRGRFAEDVDNLAGLVEFAFSEADQSMTREESEVRDRYSVLLEGLKQAREQRSLSPLDHQRFDEELKKVESNRERLKNELTTHHSWQEVHNKLHELDSVRETNRFEKELKLYRNTGLPKLLALVDRELGQAHPYRAVTAEPEQGGVAPVVRQAPPPLSPGAPDTCHAFGDDMRRLKESVEELRQGDGAVAFDKIRKPFEDAFYCVDKRTLDEVNGAEKRVVALEEWLDGLATGRRKSE